MTEYTPATAYAPSRLTCAAEASRKAAVNSRARYSRAACPTSEVVEDVVDTLDRYAEQLWRAKLPIAPSVDATALRLVWLTAGFSVPADRVDAGDYLCALSPEEIASRAHMDLREARDALQVLMENGCLEASVTGNGYRLRLDRGRERMLRASREA